MKMEGLRDKTYSTGVCLWGPFGIAIIVIASEKTERLSTAQLGLDFSI